jgi:hypothetical protein
MSAYLNRERLADLGESEYRELKGAYCRLREIKRSVDALHDDFVATGAAPGFEAVEAIHFMVDDLYEELDRYMLAESDPSSAFDPAETGFEGGVICPI